MRKPRLQFAGAVYHVIARGNHRQNVFLDDGDFVRYLSLLGCDLDKRKFKLFAYCLMTNHFHLLLQQEGEYPLWRFMQRLQGAYTIFWNLKHRRTGHLFQGRYKALVVDQDKYLVSLVKYIHLNPKRAGMERVVGEYRWTSHRQYLGKDKDPLAKVETEMVLGMISGSPASSRRYLDLLEIEEPDLINKVNEIRGGQVLGEEGFEREVFERSGRAVEDWFDVARPLPKIWKALLERNHLKIEPSGQKKSRLIGELSYLCTEFGKLTQKQVGTHFGVDQAAVSQAIKALRGRWERGEGSQIELVEWAKRDLAK